MSPKSKNGKHKPAPGDLVRAAIYRRVSTEAQGERVSPTVQLAECEAYARTHGYTVVGVYGDIERYRVRGKLIEPSAERVDRPDFKRMLADAHDGRFDVIIGWKEDRIYRGVRAAVMVDDMLEATGVTIELVKETFDRKMLFIKAAIGKIELDNIRQRTEMGKRERVRNGMHHGGPVPTGYKAIKRADGKTTGYELDPAWRGFLDDLARLFLERLSYSEMARRLPPNPRTKRPWDHSALQLMLANAWYRGELAYGWHAGDPDFTVAGQQPAAWDKATCAAIERELVRRGETVHLPRGLALWSGILRCGICGRLMTNMVARGHPARDGTCKYYRSYACRRDFYVKRGNWAGRPTHESNFIGEIKLTRMVRDRFADLKPADVDNFIARMAVGLASGGGAPDTGRIPRLQAEADALRARLEDLAVGLEGVRHASPSATEALIATITATGRQLDRTRAELAELEKVQLAAPNLEVMRSNLLRLIEHPEDFSRPLEQLQPTVRLAFPSLYVRDGKLVEPVPVWPE